MGTDKVTNTSRVTFSVVTATTSDYKHSYSQPSKSPIFLRDEIAMSVDNNTGVDEVVANTTGIPTGDNSIARPKSPETESTAST